VGLTINNSVASIIKLTQIMSRGEDLRIITQLPNPEEVVLNTLKATPISIHEVSFALNDYGADAERLAREVVLKLVEEEKARFNDNWFIEKT